MWRTNRNGAYLLLAVAAISSLVMLSHAGEPPDPDTAAAADARYAELHQAMPPVRVTLGYVSDLTGDGPFYQAQYALAPVILERGTGHDLILGNFSSPAAIEKAVAGQHLTIYRDFGNGVLLLRKAAP